MTIGVELEAQILRYYPALLPRREMARRHHRAPVACAPRHVDL